MNCDDFQERLDECLDRRSCPEADGILIDHAESCAKCSAKLDAWRNVESLLRPAPIGTDFTGTTSSYRQVARVMVSLAGMILLILVVSSDPSPLHRLVSDLSTPASRSDALAEGSLAYGSVQDNFRAEDRQHGVSWWKDIQGGEWVDRDWIQQTWVSRTMPTVRSMQEGVAPLGRTLMRAVTILTLGGRDQTS